MNARRLLGILSIFLATGLSLGAQNPPASPQTPTAPAKPGTGVIAGQLVEAGSGAPVTSAVVTLWPPTAPMQMSGDGTPLPDLITPAGAPQPLRTFVDASGHFVFHSLPPGAYSISAARPGYLAAFFGQTQPKAPVGGGRRVQLADAGRVTDVTLRMWKLGAITGTLVDEAGDPSVGTTLRLLITGSASPRPYRMYTTAITDDRGVFRFGSLPPGDYIVSVPSTTTSQPVDVMNAFADELEAGPRGPRTIGNSVISSGGNLGSGGIRVGDSIIVWSGRTGPLPGNAVRADGKVWAYPTTYYPATSSWTAATVITLRSGEERSGVGISLKPVPTARISGTVIGPNGPLAYTVLNFVPASMEEVAPSSTTGPELAQTVTREDGTFVALGVPAGEYFATVVKTPSASDVVDVADRSAGPPQRGPILWGKTPVSVGSTDIDRLIVRVSTGSSVSGRLVFEPGTTALPTAAVLARSRVTIVPPDGRAGLRPTVATIGADNSFVSPTVVPSRYTIGPPILPGWSVKSVTHAGRELSGSSVQVTSDVTDVVITYTDKAGELAGSVPKADTDVDVVAFLVPVATQSASPYDLGRMRTVAVSSDGTFAFGGVVPGDYAVVVIAAPPAARTDALIASWLARGTRITLGDREKRSVTLSIIR